MKAPETTTHDNQVDGPKPEDTDTEAGGGESDKKADTALNAKAARVELFKQDQM